MHQTFYVFEGSVLDGFRLHFGRFWKGFWHSRRLRADLLASFFGSLKRMLAPNGVLEALGFLWEGSGVDFTWIWNEFESILTELG